MATKQKKVSASTQSFIELKDIIDNIVIFNNWRACLILEVSATNFSLLSTDEQDARIGAYASFLNSLSFPVQILLVNKRVDISSYLTLLDSEIAKNQNNPTAFSYMQKYKMFVTQLVQENTVLDKRFYIVVPYSYLEGAGNNTIGHQKQKPQSGYDEFITNAKAALQTKADGVKNQLSRINLQSKILQRDALISLFTDIYHQTDDGTDENEDISIGITQ